MEYEGDLELYAAVLSTTGLGLVVCDRYVRSVTYCGQTLEVYALLDQVITNGVSTFLRQLFIDLVLTGAIRVTLNLNVVVRVLNEDLSNLVQQREGFLLNGSLTGLELNTLHSFLEQV